MNGSLDSPPVILHGRRLRWLWRLIFALAFVAIGVTAHDMSATVRLLDIVVFGLCVVVFLWMLIEPPRLEIGPTGIVQMSLWRTNRFAWADIHNIRTIALSLTYASVGFDYRLPNGTMRLRPLQAGWEIDPHALVEMLCQARERWLASSGNAVQIAAPLKPVFNPLTALWSSRIDRKVYWMATVIILAIVFSLSFIPGIDMQHGVGSVTTILWIRLFAGRLHDFGRSAWWQIIVFLSEFLAIIFIMLAAHQSRGLAVVVVLLIHIVFTIVLGAIPGDPAKNRFGPAPGNVGA